jgi:uncharacterized protein YutE (UPF0331/DUF86 family)
MKDDVVVNKLTVIKRCMDRVNEVYAGDAGNLQDLTKQDSIVLNIQRSCEAAIDLAMHVVSEKKLGLPQSSREAFKILNQNGIIDASLALRLEAMVGFRNIAVHDYQSINLVIVKKIIEEHLIDFVLYAEKILVYS